MSWAPVKHCYLAVCLLLRKKISSIEHPPSLKSRRLFYAYINDQISLYFQSVKRSVNLCHHLCKIKPSRNGSFSQSEFWTINNLYKMPQITSSRNKIGLYCKIIILLKNLKMVVIQNGCICFRTIILAVYLLHLFA